MKNKTKILGSLLLINLVFCSAIHGQLLAPRKPSKVNLIIESGVASEFMSENSFHGFVTGSATVQLGKILIVRGLLTHGTKSRFNNLKSKTSFNQLFELHFSPLNKYWGCYGAFDYGNRNYKFENLEQFDVESGASSKQPNPTKYTSSEITNNAVLQFAIPTYRFGFGWYYASAESESGDPVNFQFSLFGCYSPMSQTNNIQSEFNLYNLNVPVQYKGAGNLKISKGGFGALFLLQSQIIGGRLEVGKRPTLYQNDQYVTGAKKGLFFYFGLNFRLI